MGGTIILGAVAFIILWYFVAKEFEQIAAMKGHPETKYFWWTFLMGAVGIFMVVALPNSSGAARREQNTNDELPEI